MARIRPPIWLTTSSRWAGLSKPQARLVLALLVLLLAATLLALAGPPVSRDPAEPGASRTDVELYRAIVADMRHGAPYYEAAATELRAGDYPLKPFVTFPLPTLAVVQAALPAPVVSGLLYALALSVWVAWYLRLREGLGGWRPQFVALVLLAGGLVTFIQVELAPFHEIWAGLLIALSLALRRPGRWLDAVAVALIAMLVRETAALFVLVMGIAALAEGRRREAIGWGVALAIFAVAVALHARAVAGVVRTDDLTSPGWQGLLGFGFCVKTMAASTALHLVPDWLAAPLLGLALFGWASWRSQLSARVLATFGAYAVLLGIFGRADTFYWGYWGLLVAPLPLLGLVFAPDGLRDLVAAMLDRRRVIVKKRATGGRVA